MTSDSVPDGRLDESNSLDAVLDEISDRLGRGLATGKDRGTVNLWGMQSLEIEKNLDGHGGPVLHVEFTPDGEQLCASGGVFKEKWDSGEAVLWDLKSGEKRSFVTHAAQVTVAAFAPGNRLVTGGHHSATGSRTW